MDQQVQKREENKITVDKYDRQIRLWGPRGQRALGNARVALVKCTGPGIQALKNLILPGVGVVDIWDNSLVSVADLSSSFFYEQESVGKLKAQVASHNLLQMNPDSKGSFVNKGFQQFIQDENSIKSYNLVIFGGDLNENQLKKASQKMWKLNIPCIFITVAGFFFYIRLQKPTHFVESSNSLQKKYYLRISDPFPQLLEHAHKNCVYKSLQKIKGKKSQDSKDDLTPYSYFQNIPSVLVLTSVVEKLPKQSRKKIPQIVKALKQIELSADVYYRQNIVQSIKQVINAIRTPDNYMIDIGLLFNNSVTNANKDSHLMLKFLQAVKEFFEQNHEKLPQPTILPDMHTTTERYIQLKNIYKAKHQQDIKIIVQKIKKKFGDEKVDEQLISQYINNLNNLQVVEMKPYTEQMLNPDFSSYYMNEKDIYIAIRAYQKVTNDGSITEVSYDRLKQVADELMQQYKIAQYDQRYLKEVFRSKGQSNISIFSIAGAMVGQEAIKLITNCFTPMNGGYLFNGALGNGFQVKL